jgi:hypothetical protein
MGDFAARPSPLRAGALALFCLFGLWPVLSSDASFAFRIAGFVLLLGFPLIVLGMSLTRVELRGDYLDVRTPGRRVRGNRSDISIEPFSTGVGSSGIQRALNFRHASGSGVTLVLHVFSSADQQTLMCLLATGSPCSKHGH